MEFVTIKNSRDFSVTVQYKNAAGDVVSKEVKAGETIDVSKDQLNALEAQINTATAPVDVKSVVQAELAPIMQKMEDMKKEMLDSTAKEPRFTKTVQSSTATSGKEDLDAMGYKERHGAQINFAFESLTKKSNEAATKLNYINEYHFEKLKEKGLITNSMTIADMGNFVISPELLTDIAGHRSNFQPLLSKLSIQETLSLQMAWLQRNGDINMQEVEMCDDGEDGNLKPISEYDAAIKTSNLHELAAVTPVCNAATRFLAVDLLGDIAKGYRTDYDRKLAQLFIARLQQAVNETGNTVPYNLATGATNPLNSFINTAALVAEETDNGVFIMNTSSYYELVRRSMAAGINTDTGFGLFTTGNVQSLVGRQYIVVPNELMPTLNTAETKTFVVEGTNVTINKGMFYVDLDTYTGRTSGGLQYDLSTEAAYEVGDEVRSAFQRNELVLRGSFFRGGAIKDPEMVAAMSSAGIS